MVTFGGSAPATTFVNSTQLTAVIPAAAIATAGTVAATVTNPAPGGGTSNAVNFTITSGTGSVPTIDGLDQLGAAVGGPAFILRVSGSNFVASSVARWNGSDLPTTVVSSTLLTAQIPASDIATTGTATVTVFNPAPGSGSSNPSTFTIARGGLGPDSVAVDPTGKLVYVANSGSNDVSMYTINATTGALTLMGRVHTELSPTSIAIDRSGKFAYVTNLDNLVVLPGNVSTYTINPTTGTLTSLGSPVASDFGADSVAVDPFARFVYVANGGTEDSSGSVSAYTINATTGALTSTGTIMAGGTPFSVAVDPSGNFAYVANEGGFAPTNVSMFTINATTGALTSIGAITAGGRAVSVAVHPSGKFAYVADGFPGGNVSMYTINATTGALTSVGLVVAGTSPTAVVVDPTGKFAYVTNSDSDNVSMYTINATTGTLTSLGTMSAGLFPSSIAIDPSGKFAYVTNSYTSEVSMYSIDTATGELTLIGTIGT